MTYTDYQGTVRCTRCNGPRTVREGLVHLAHLSWCTRRRPVPARRTVLLALPPDVEPIDDGGGGAGCDLQRALAATRARPDSPLAARPCYVTRATVM